MAVEFDIVPEGEVRLRQVGLGDPSIVGSINILAEISASEDDDLDMTLTFPEGTPEQVREIFDYLADILTLVDVGYAEEATE